MTKAADAEVTVADCDVGSGGWGVEVLSNASILNDAGTPGNQHHPKSLVLHSTVTFLKNRRKFVLKILLLFKTIKNLSPLFFY